MDPRNSRNVQKVFCMLAAEWSCPVWMVERIIQQTIDTSWEKAVSDPNEIALWEKYFPQGKPTPYEYILRLGEAHENGEDVPYLFK